MSMRGSSAEGGTGLQSPSTARVEASRKRRRSAAVRSVYDDEDEAFGTSINPLFLLSGPRGGAISAHHAATEIDALADLVDDSVYRVLRQAWATVAVPADTYWNCPQHQYTTDVTASLLLRHDGAAATTPSSALKASPVRIPHPRLLPSSFYPARVEALAARGYHPHRGLLPIALDRRGGKGSKVFNVLMRTEADAADSAPADLACRAALHGTRCASAVANFISDIPTPLHRNLYVMVDEDAPVDPYFDVDLSYTAGVDDTSRLSLLRLASGDGGGGAASSTALRPADVEAALLTVLTSLRHEVEQVWGTPVAECLVLSSSVQVGRHVATSDAAPSPVSVEELKLSFHVHFRLANNAVVRSVRELHAFMSGLRTRLQRAQEACTRSEKEDLAEARRLALLLACVDFGVYTRWRAFRLPYNVKASEDLAAASPAKDGTWDDDLLQEQLAQLGCVLPDVSVGSVAPAVLQCVHYAADAEVEKRQRYLLGKLFLYHRFLLPLLPDRTKFTNAVLADFLRPLTPPGVKAAAQQPTAAARCTVGTWVTEMACIVRDASLLLAAPTPDRSASLEASSTGATMPEERDVTAAAFQLLSWPPAGTEPAVAPPLQPTADASPFDLPMPPRPHSARVSVTNKEVKRLLAEVFWCLAPDYAPGANVPSSGGLERPPLRSAGAGVTPERINAQYEESIRAYYVFQKQSRFCFRLQRTHRATYVQLYLTFCSIKLRCYSNDCCDGCCAVPWEVPKEATSPPAEGATAALHPNYARLTEIRNLLFPPLPAGELVRRYGTALLQRQP